MDLKELQKELLVLSKIGDPTVQMRGNIVSSQWGDVVKHLTHDQDINPTVRPHGTKMEEINDAGHFLVQALTYLALREIDAEEAIETAMIALQTGDVLKVAESSPGIMVYPGPITGVALVVPVYDDRISMLFPMEHDTILVTDHPRSGLSRHASHISGLITDQGGMTCHAAIVAREFEIPCVVGTGNATKQINNGDKITITKGGMIEWEKKS